MVEQTGSGGLRPQNRIKLRQTPRELIQQMALHAMIAFGVAAVPAKIVATQSEKGMTELVNKIPNVWKPKHEEVKELLAEMKRAKEEKRTWKERLGRFADSARKGAWGLESGPALKGFDVLFETANGVVKTSGEIAGEVTHWNTFWWSLGAMGGGLFSILNYYFITRPRWTKAEGALNEMQDENAISEYRAFIVWFEGVMARFERISEILQDSALEPSASSDANSSKEVERLRKKLESELSGLYGEIAAKIEEIKSEPQSEGDLTASVRKNGELMKKFFDGFNATKVRLSEEMMSLSSNTARRPL